MRTVGIYVWEKVKDYLTKAGTTIFHCIHYYLVPAELWDARPYFERSPALAHSSERC